MKPHFGSSIILAEEAEDGDLTSEFGDLTHSSSISTLIEESLYENSGDDETAASTTSHLENEDEFGDERQHQFLTMPRKKKHHRCLSILSLNSSRLSTSTSHLTSNSNISTSSLTSRTFRLDPEMLRQTRLLPDLNSMVNMLGNPRLLLPVQCDRDRKMPVEVLITDIVDCERFWAQLADRNHQATMDHIAHMLNFETTQTRSGVSERYRLQALDKREVHLEGLCVAHFTDQEGNRLLYRAKVVNTDLARMRAEIQYVDYGNREVKAYDELYSMEERLKQYPFQAIECRLQDIKPCLLRNPTGVWTKKSVAHFKKMLQSETEYRKLTIKVEDVDDHDVVLCDLLGMCDFYIR
jgi:hypothetical protein